MYMCSDFFIMLEAKVVISFLSFDPIRRRDNGALPYTFHVTTTPLSLLSLDRPWNYICIYFSLNFEWIKRRYMAHQLKQAQVRTLSPSSVKYSGLLCEPSLLPLAHFFSQLYISSFRVEDRESLTTHPPFDAYTLHVWRKGRISAEIVDRNRHFFEVFPHTEQDNGLGWWNKQITISFITESLRVATIWFSWHSVHTNPWPWYCW